MKAKRRKTSSSTDRATAYAEAVLSGAVVAGPHVRNACRRHLDDLRRKDIRFDAESAARALRFFENKLKLSEGQFENTPFKSQPAQDFIIGSIFGWKRPDGTRRFRRAYIEQGKGNGKSPLAGGIGLYGLMADNEAGAEVYSAGATKDQAAVLFRDAVKMVGKSPDLDSRLKMSGGPGREFNIAYLKNSSFFRPVSRETKKTGSGPRPHFALVDELHEHPDAGIIEILERGFKFRRQPLLLMITNSGSDRNSVCYSEHLHAVKVAAGSLSASDGDAEYVGEVIDDTTFSYVCALDGERVETFNYGEAMRHMQKSCTCHSVSTTQTDQILVETFVGSVTLSGGGSKAAGGAQSIPTSQSSNPASVQSASGSEKSSGRQQLKRDVGNIKGAGTQKIRTGFANTKSSGSQHALDIDWQNLKNKLLEITGLRAPSLTSSSKSRTANAPSVASSQNGFVSIIATVLANTEGCFVSPATQESVFSEILRKVWSAHSSTCEVRKSELQGASLSAKLPADDPLEDPTCWVKANPLVGVTITEEYLAGVVAQAKALPGKLNGILRLHFCVWTDAITAWISRRTLETVLADFDPEQEAYEEVHAGVDLSASRDLTAEAFCAETGTNDEGKPTFDAWVEAWTPAETLQQRAIEDKAPYDQWVKTGILRAVPGKTVDFDYPAKHLSDVQQVFKLGRIAYDRYAFRKFEQACEGMGLELDFIEHPQGGKRRAKPPDAMVEAAKQAGQEPPLGLWMPGSLNELETLILERRIRIRISPVIISAMMSAAIETDPFENRWFRKSKSTQRIDPAVALAMAVGAATMKVPVKTRSFWETAA